MFTAGTAERLLRRMFEGTQKPVHLPMVCGFFATKILILSIFMAGKALILRE